MIIIIKRKGSKLLGRCVLVVWNVSVQVGYYRYTILVPTSMWPQTDNPTTEMYHNAEVNMPNPLVFQMRKVFSTGNPVSSMPSK